MRRYSSSSSLQRASSISEVRSYEQFESTSIQVPVKIKSSDRDEKTSILIFQISMNQIQGTHHFALNIEITDEADPFFLYALELDEQGFHVIKQEQLLHVDFLTFPHNILELLRLCMKPYEDKYSCSIQKASNQEATLRINENNNMRELNHLALRFRSANDEIIKAHLAKNLKEFKARSEDWESKFHKCEEALELRSAEFNDIRRQYEKLFADCERKIEEQKLQGQADCQTIRQQMLDTQRTAQMRYEEEKKFASERYEQKINELSSKLELYQNKSNELTGNKSSLEGRERELTSRVQSLEHELELALNELNLLRTSNKTLETTKFEHEKSITEFKLRMQHLERQLQDKEEMNQKLNSLIETNNVVRTQQEDNTSMLKATIMKLEDKLHQSAGEINKGNSIIQKLQSEIKTGKQKLKLKNTVVLQQESIIQQKQEFLDNADKSIAEIKRELVRKDDLTRNLEEKEANLKAQLADAQAKLQTNHDLIQFLNSKLNEAEKGKIGYVSSYKPITAPSPIQTFKPSGYTFETIKPAPRSPLLNATNTISGSTTPDTDNFTKFLEPIKNNP
ncbi:unnamed protein product [Blepharisma stoltei]|uniref:Spindle assembly abnormal protein 6 N-terminal domain-containing protein n=1 Tax=Blepharisma stoltei TaxID=1481888 RepID=A0AAU9K573_9CILI|nr:unnamed protein product [Blepharisma stoltei]